MQDRVSKYPNRFYMQVLDSASGLVQLTRADEPEIEGDPLSKRTFLTDETAGLYFLDTTAVPNDVFRVLSSRTRYKVIGQTEAGENASTVSLTLDDVQAYRNFVILASTGSEEGIRPLNPVGNYYVHVYVDKELVAKTMWSSNTKTPRVFRTLPFSICDVGSSYAFVTSAYESYISLLDSYSSVSIEIASAVSDSYQFYSDAAIIVLAS